MAKFRGSEPYDGTSYTPDSSKNHASEPKLFLCCGHCGAIKWPDVAQLPKDGVAIIGCYRCGMPQSFELSKVPHGFTPEAETCSPDSSAIAYYVPAGGRGTSVMPKRLRKPSHASASNTSDKLQRLRELQQEEAKELETYKDDPVMTANIRKLFDRERRKLLGNSSE